MKEYTPEDVRELREKVLLISGVCNQYSPQQVADLINAAGKEVVEAEREACAELVKTFRDTFLELAETPEDVEHESWLRSIAWQLEMISYAILARGVKEG